MLTCFFSIVNKKKELQFKLAFGVDDCFCEAFWEGLASGKFLDSIHHDLVCAPFVP